MVMYEKVKVAEATSGAIVTPGGELIKENYQYLHRIADNTMRFFLCRSIWCSEMNGGQGNFYGLNTDWIHTEVTGGGQYACPACGSQFKAGSRATAVIPAHFAMVMTDTESVMLSAWPAGAEENAIANFMEVMAEDEMKVDFEKYRGLSMDDLTAEIVSFVKRAAAPSNFALHKLTDKVRKHIHEQNSSRTKKHPWSYEHIKDGYNGAFVRVTKDTPIMTEEDTKKMLAAIKVHSDRHLQDVENAV